MVQELVVKCPHCQQVAEIFLSTSACVIVLNCPTCSSPIMYFDHKIFVLSNKQLEALKNNSRHNAMNEIKKLAQSPQIPVPKKQTHHTRAEQSSMCKVTPRAAPRSGMFSRKIHIGRDEITNLKIELALCNDVQEFIDRM
jgi:endogenous inhibitor of DNA gyrase (YacG/DUF329 family)